MKKSNVGRRTGEISGARPTIAFTLIEVMVVVVLLSFIVFALMAVFNSTQTAFRASLTQSDVLEGGRAAMDLMTEDLREMAPSLSANTNAANIYVAVTYSSYLSPPSPLYQPLVASSFSRTNVLENFFVLNLGNANGVPTWYGVAYAVQVDPDHLYSLYRFGTNHPVASVGPAFIFTNDFGRFLTNVTSGSHLLDGVVDLTVRAYDTNGLWMNSAYTNAVLNFRTNVTQFGETGFKMFSNMVPASVQIEMGVLEDQTLQRADALRGSPLAQSNYLAQQAGKVHLFRQRVSISNVDPSAYQ